MKTTLGRSLSVLAPSDRKKVSAVVVLQILMGFLDLLGVMAVGLLAALSVTELQSANPGNRVGDVLGVLQLQNLSFQTQAAILGLGAVFLLVGRTILSIFFTKRILSFFSHRGASISAQLISRLLAQPLLTVMSRSAQETVYAVTVGVGQITLQVLAVGVVLLSDFSLLVVMAVGLFVVDPTTALGTFGVFSLIGYVLYRIMHVKVRELSVENTDLSITSNEKIVEVLSSYREALVGNRRDYYAREIGKLRFKVADASAELSFMPYVSKYVIESSVVLGALLIGSVQFVLQDASHAIATIAIFLAAGTRIAPAVLRIQQASTQIRGSLAAATPTLDLIETLENSIVLENVEDSLDTLHRGFYPEIQLSNSTLTYPNQIRPAVKNISLTIPAGVSVALVGPSGAGKTTIVDILLGVLIPDEGGVLISGEPPLSAFAKWPGAVSYVPQDVVIVAGSIRENVALGYPPEAATDELVLSALKIAQLDEFVENLPHGLDTQVGERGTKISGGQRQRLGIARAMFTRPQLLVLDEATSSLDGETEASISAAIHALRGATTAVMIAHRLSTVRSADIVVYLSEGKMLAKGTFEEVRAVVPDFDRQAKLMGI